MRKFLLILIILSASLLYCNEVDTLYFLQTTDIHGHILSYDYKFDKETDHGLDRIATLIDSFRTNHKYVILLENGDLFQGSPLSDYYFNHQNTTMNPIIDVVNSLGYEAMTVGNHEIEYGPEIYDELEATCNFPWLSANALTTGDSTYFEPYIITERNGITIGILGLTTPAIPVWLNKDKYPDITWEDMKYAAARYVPILRPQVDILVGLFHSGLKVEKGAEQTKRKGLPPENDSAVVGAVVEGFDIIMSGHSHELFPPKKIVLEKSNSPIYINPGFHSYHLGVVEVIIEHSKNGNKIIKRSAWNIPVDQIEPNEKIVELMQPSHIELQNFLNKGIVHVTDKISTENAYFEDNIITELINKAQLDYTGADISFAPCFNPKLNIENRDFLVKDAYIVYPYENTLFLIELTGADVIKFLEKSAEFFQIVDGEVTKSSTISGYNYDMAEGISYKIDPTRTIGNRIIDPTFKNKPLQLNKTYRVAINSFRFNGGGGLLENPVDNPITIILETDAKVRDIFIKYLAAKETIDLNVDRNWKLIQ